MRRITSVFVSLAALVVSSAAQGSLVVDLKLNSGGGKTATVAPGDVVQIDVYVSSVGSDGLVNERLQTFGGDILSSLNGVKPSLPGTIAVNGDLMGPNFDTIGLGLDPFSDNGSQSGTLADLNGSGNLDLKAFIARSPSMKATGGVRTTNTTTWYAGRISFTVGAGAVDGEATELNFSFADVTPANGAIWMEDGAGKDGSTGTVTAGTPIILSTPAAVPEPMGLGLVCLGSLVLMSRGRKA